MDDLYGDSVFHLVRDLKLSVDDDREDLCVSFRIPIHRLLEIRDVVLLTVSLALGVALSDALKGKS